MCVLLVLAQRAVLAAQLAKKKIDVLLLEAGADLPDYSCESIAGTNLFQMWQICDLGGLVNLAALQIFGLAVHIHSKRLILKNVLILIVVGLT